jgi:hypothetical protein
MHSTFKVASLAGLVVALSSFSLPASPARADELLKDVAVGAATNTVVGGVTNNGRLLRNAVGGAATGAAVSATHDSSHSRARGIAQDAAVGAATNAVTGAVLGNGDLLENAIGGAASGAAVNVGKEGF